MPLKFTGRVVAENGFASSLLFKNISRVIYSLANIKNIFGKLLTRKFQIFKIKL